MTTKKRRRTYAITTDERIMQLYRQLGMTFKEARKEYNWMKLRIQSKQLSIQ